MALSILYCRECDAILAAAPGLGLTVECASHGAGSKRHRGCVVLRLPDVDLAEVSAGLDLTALAAQYPKATHAESLEPVGSCA